ncbi:MAG: PhzF family phenazine biosynthesis protein [Alphaproteobacteria bacterium]
MERRFATLDVFTDTVLEGNPLAVVLDSQGLTADQMQAIATEFNLSETVFVLPPDNPVHSVGVRIFTPYRELSFAGHPTVGTAVLHALLRNRDAPVQKEMVVLLEEAIGSVRCGVFVQGERAGHAIFDLPKLPQPVDQTFSRETIAGALGLVGSEIGFENHVPIAFDAGAPYCAVPVRDLDTLAKVAPNQALWAAAFGPQRLPAYIYTRQVARTDRDFRARMFSSMLGFREDPATGGAVAALTGAVFKFDALRAGQYRLVVEQGVEMGRPSLIVMEIDVAGGAIDAARIGGDAVLVSEGTLDI